MPLEGATGVPTQREAQWAPHFEEGERRAVRVCAERRRSVRGTKNGTLTLTVSGECHEVAVAARAPGDPRGTPPASMVDECLLVAFSQSVFLRVVAERAEAHSEHLG